MILIGKNKDKLIELCNKYRVEELYLFGSVLKNEFNDSSDIDMLIKFQKIKLPDYFDNYMGLKEELEKLFHRSVELIENHTIKNPVFRKIVEREKRLIYERKSA